MTHNHDSEQFDFAEGSNVAPTTIMMPPEPVKGKQLPPPAQGPICVTMMHNFSDNLQSLAHYGQVRGELSIAKTFLMGIYAGAYIAFGGLLGDVVLSNCPALVAANPGLGKLLFAMLFPVGLYMHAMHGTELFTGNTMKQTVALMQGQNTIINLAKNWFFSYFGNMAGSLLMVGLAVGSGVLTGAQYPIHMAVAKCSDTFGQTLIRGILCNWLVNVAVWCYNSAQSVEGKLLGLFPPIMCFVASGFQHSVANMFLVPVGMALGAPISVGQFLSANLIPVTIGNIIGGMVMVGLGSATFYGSLGEGKPGFLKRRQGN